MTGAVVEIVRRRLRGPLPGVGAQMRMAPTPRPQWDPAVGPPLRAAAALVLLYPHADRVWLPLTVRASTLAQHTGQVSLPGGRLAEGESVESAALREAFEEVGVAQDTVTVLGRLTPLPIPVSGHLLHPVVGLAETRPSFTVAAGEVERLIEVPVSLLMAPGTVGWEHRRRERPPAGLMHVPFFDVDGVHVWGATAMVLAEFLAVLEPDLAPERDGSPPAAQPTRSTGPTGPASGPGGAEPPR